MSLQAATIFLFKLSSLLKENTKLLKITHAYTSVNLVSRMMVKVQKQKQFVELINLFHSMSLVGLSGPLQC